ncbi:MAG: hydroxymethylbilane synthase [Alphaproteobacteria bacterium]|nr:hydroxymethylbilane synthase [Alphaproteobacteria bacterium]
MEKDFRKIRIGTRGSPLALTQTEMVRAALVSVFPHIETQVIIIKTSGDWSPAHGEVVLSEGEGGKGLFAREIEAALLRGEIDAAVHSMKDMDSNLPVGLSIDHMLKRQDARDALILCPKLRALSSGSASETSQDLEHILSVLPRGARLGTSSVRRSAFLLRARPDLEMHVLRGNVQTRLDKLAAGQVDATLLAMAGLNRLGLFENVDVVLPVQVMLPAAGQGAVGIELRRGDDELFSVFEKISCMETVLRVKAEREVLRVLDGSCRTPIGVHAVYLDGCLALDVQVLSPDGRQVFTDRITGEVASPSEAVALGYDVGLRLREIVPSGFFLSGAAGRTVK